MDNTVNIHESQKQKHKQAKQQGSRVAAVNRVFEYALTNLMLNPIEFTIQNSNHILQRSRHFKDVARKLFTPEDV